MKINAATSAILRSGLDPIWQKIYAKPLRECERGLKDWSASSHQLQIGDAANAEALQLFLFLKHELSEHFKRIRELRTRQADFNYNYHHATSDTERTEHMVAATKYLRYPSRIVSKVSRNKLKWFDDAAISECFEKKVSEQEKFIIFALGRICEVARCVLELIEDDAELSRHWEVMALPDSLTESLSYQAQANIRIAACRGLRHVLQELPDAIRHAVPGTTVQYVYRVCLDADMHIWMRAEMMMLIAVTQPTQYLDIFKYVQTSEDNADMFLKGRMIEGLLRFVPITGVSLRQALKVARYEPSEYVRQRFAEATRYVPADVALRLVTRQLQTEKSPKVNAQLVLAFLQHDWSQQQLDTIVDTLLRLLKSDASAFLLRTVLHVLPRLLHKYCTKHGTCLKIDAERFAAIDEQLTWLNTHHEDTRLRRWAAECREAIFFVTSTAAFDDEQRQALEQLPMEASLQLKLKPDELTESWYRQLAHIASRRFGFNVRFDAKSKRKNGRVLSGFRFRPRLWRIIHEWRKPSTDKRQNHNHIKGRVYYGLHQFNSRIVAEQSITKVPGEPIYINEESGERSYLPLVDQLISCLDQGWPTEPLRIYSSEGVTEITPPSGLYERFKARWQLQWQFARFARLRNWQQGDSFDASAYLKKVTQLGFKVSIRGYADAKGQQYPIEPRVKRFFPAVALPFTMPSLNEAYNYFYSVYQNTITQLLAFTSVAFAAFMGSHIWKIADLRRHRNKLPLVIGGWGTRGKSGTERLKAAVLNELGLSVLSKTTGCEAMFVYGNANRPMKEMFLFRPYDKATIWEQVFLTRFSAKLGVDVFLWECMGLTPRYIEILQSQWMRDDISTITNCYPDHEDIQGPAGIEIPIVMQNFIPKKGDVYTSEESMLPVLQDEAHRKGARLTPVTWLQAGLITQDVLERFPYEEHPNNIALVQTMSQRLGVRNDVAVKSMADNVIADLGVLKIYPTVPVQGRRIEFVNGMSANERLGALGNWERTGFSSHNLDDTPEVWTSIVVNNRADRVARSRVFAEMLVSDIQADRYYFIGNNLDGLQTYITEAWQSFAEQFREGWQQEDSEQKFNALCKRYRIATDIEPVKERIAAALKGIDVADDTVESVIAGADTWQSDEQIDQAFAELEQPADAIAPMAKQLHSEHRHWQSLHEAGKLTSRDAIDEVLEWIFECFKQRWVVVENYYSTGNQTVQTMIDNTPPGLQTRIIGVQNIKGTGLDFVYRWQAWDRVHAFGTTLRESRNQNDVQTAARGLATWQEYGVLDKEFITETIKIARGRQICQQESIQADLKITEQQLKRQLAEMEKALDEGSIDSGWRNKVLTSVEAFLDSSDAVKRRKTSQAIYKAMLNNTISVERATFELAELNKAQKGGWLVRTIKRRFAERKNS